MPPTGELSKRHIILDPRENKFTGHYLDFKERFKWVKKMSFTMSVPSSSLKAFSSSWQHNRACRTPGTVKADCGLVFSACGFLFQGDKNRSHRTTTKNQLLTGLDAPLIPHQYTQSAIND